MPLTLNARIIGALIGLLAGLLLVLFGWRILLILTGFALVGFLVGLWLDSHQEIRALVERSFNRLFRS